MGIRARRFYRSAAASLWLMISLGCTGPVPTGLPATGGATLDTGLEVGATDVLSSLSAPACVQAGQPSTPTQQEMLNALNLYRAQHGLSPLAYSRRLEAAINAHVRDLWARKFFDHVNPDGQEPGDRAVEAGFCHPYVGENIAAGQNSVQAVMQAWQNSPSHNENMLQPAYRYVGMGLFTDPTGRKYWGQLFAIELPE